MKKLIISMFLTLLISTPINALSDEFNIDSDNLLKNLNQINEISTLFDDKYNIDNNYTFIETNDEYLELTRKITYILLGNGNFKNESFEDYYKRKLDFLNYRYAPNIPKDSEGNLDKNSIEYSDDILSGMSVLGMWNTINDLNINYNYFGDIKITETNTGFISTVTIPNIVYKAANKETPTKFDYITTDLVIYYVFKENNGELQLLYLMSETNEDFDNYFEQIEDNEINKNFNSIASYQSDLSLIYDYSQLYKLDDSKLKNIFDENINKVMILNTFYNNSIVETGSGFLLTNNVLVTTWSNLENSLLRGQTIIISDNNGNNYNFEGIITIDKSSDIALIKIEDTGITGVILGDSTKMDIENPIISISTKSGINLGVQTGIVVSNNNKLENLLPITSFDNGSPIFNSEGEVVGITTLESINNSISYANYTNVLIDLQTKFLNDDNISIISFDQIKEKYFYSNSKSEIIKNDIDEKAWNEISKIGDLKNNLILPLVKSSYVNGIASLRYDNSIGSLFEFDIVKNKYINQLKKEGYVEINNNSQKLVYTNNKYKIIIFDEFDYLIIVMVKL